MNSNETKKEELVNLTDKDVDCHINFAATNARSLPPKMLSMIENFNELQLSFFAITETWLKNNKQTEREIKDLSDSEQLGLLAKNRKKRGGGVAIIYNKNLINLKKNFLWLTIGSKYYTVREN